METSKKKEKFMTINEVAKLINVPYHLVLEQVRVGNIPSYHPAKKYYLSQESLEKARQIFQVDEEPKFETKPVRSDEEINQYDPGRIVTKDIYLASALSMSGCNLEKIEIENTIAFFTLTGDNIHEVRTNYFNNALPMDLKTFVHTMKNLKSRAFYGDRL